ncbi:cupin domain-containing protein [Rhizohabitans arisaemae]|uniref:cupin domain-containing protein n=1 Tax=Rhizohabitans arisaemae TaxID=2720610 RepID=UPI0024B1E871|nr:cupin domain-containing protein [Rhizohabitans arisaemae]
MKVIHGRETDAPSIKQSDGFTGEVWADPVLRGAEGASVHTVFFAPGARTHWHRHSHGQILHITGGSGVVVTRDEAVEVRAGDTVWSPPGAEHWHGAGEDGYLIHTAISLGEHTWLDPVTDEEYKHRLDPGNR